MGNHRRRVTGLPLNEGGCHTSIRLLSEMVGNVAHAKELHNGSNDFLVSYFTFAIRDHSERRLGMAPKGTTQVPPYDVLCPSLVGVKTLRADGLQGSCRRDWR